MHKPKPIGKISPRMVERQEELFGRLKALTSEVQAMAGRRPKRGVPQEVLVRAEAMLFEVGPFRERRGRRELPLAAPHYGALAGQLAEALAALVAFETRHTQWDARFNEPVWSTTGPFVMKLKRLEHYVMAALVVRGFACAKHLTMRAGDGPGVVVVF